MIRQLMQAIIILIWTAVLAGFAMAHGQGHGISVKDAWIRTTPPGTTFTAAYMMLQNHSKNPDRLIGASSLGARAVEIHEAIKKGGMLHMQPVTGGIKLPAKGMVSLKPGGYHLMVIGLGKAIKPGDKIELVLEFERNPTIRTTAIAKKIGDSMEGHKMGSSHKGHDHKMKKQ